MQHEPPGQGCIFYRYISAYKISWAQSTSSSHNTKPSRTSHFESFVQRRDRWRSVPPSASKCLVLPKENSTGQIAYNHLINWMVFICCVHISVDWCTHTDYETSRDFDSRMLDFWHEIATLFVLERWHEAYLQGPKVSKSNGRSLNRYKTTDPQSYSFVPIMIVCPIRFRGRTNIRTNLIGEERTTLREFGLQHTMLTIEDIPAVFLKGLAFVGV